MAVVMMPQTMIDIAASGGGLDIDCSINPVMPQTMKAIAAAAASSGKKPTIIFRHMVALMPQIAIEVAAAGQGCVIFAL